MNYNFLEKKHLIKKKMHHLDKIIEKMKKVFMQLKDDEMSSGILETLFADLHK